MCNKIAHTVVYSRLYQLHCGTSNSGYVKFESVSVTDQ